MASYGQRNCAFLSGREVTLGGSGMTFLEQTFSPLKLQTGSVTPRHHQKYELPNWSLARLRTYMDMLRAFGFNSVQLYDTWQSYVNAGWARVPEDWKRLGEEPWESEPRDWPQKMDAVADYARSAGLRTTLFVWGNTAFDYETNTGYYALCPNDPAERPILDRYWEHQARHAAHFDHVVTHWGDPGGCRRNGCTITTALELHNAFVARCRRYNPSLASSFSLWMLGSAEFGRWPGYEGPRTVLESGLLAPDVGVAAHGLPEDFRFDDVRAVAAAGRKAGVWSWYLVNNEIYPSCYANAGRLRTFFAGLPPEASSLIAWLSVDSNNHTLNLHSLYVAGALMRDPGADPRRLLREFAAGALGPANAEAVVGLLGIIEELRPSWPTTYGDAPLSVSRAREAQALARTIRVPDGFRPAFPLVIAPQDLARELVAQAEALTQFAEFCAAAAEVEEMKRTGASPAALKAALAALPAVARPTEFMTQLEYCHYLRKREALESATRGAPAQHRSP